MNKKERARFYINSEGPDESAIGIGIKWLAEIGKDNPKKRKSLFAINQLHELEDGSILADFLGDKRARQLRQSKQIEFKDDFSMNLFLARQRDLYSWNGPVLALYPTAKLLDKVEDLYEVTDILVISRRIEEIQPWIYTWGVPELGTSQQSVPISQRPMHPEVEARLKEISHMNSGDCFTHPSDHKRIVEIFRSFKKRGVPYDSNEIRAWLIREGGCKSGAADEVKSIAQSILDGKRIHAV
ncbi:MAG: hypothetical protein C4519_27325 [Desulfobacteraceae bacterium]|nr:MAG: hypothetical protein C4519_27325 [Desulfobacteraceae bacterium]